MKKAVLLLGVAMSLRSALVSAATLPPAPPPRSVELSLQDACNLLQRQFGLECGDVDQEDEFFHFVVEGFLDGSRNCPMEGIPGMRCGGLEFIPSEAWVSRKAWVAPVSGHLAQNLVVAVSLFAINLPPSSSSMHGILVMQRQDLRSRKAAFGWYIGRQSTPRFLEFQDVTGDGVLDVLYTYQMYLGPYGRVVARDLWTFEGLTPERVISSGELLNAIFGGIFEGLALWWDGEYSESSRVRGDFRFEQVQPGAPALGIFERARSDPRGPSMDFWVLGDFGEGWVLALAGTGEAASSRESADEMDCSPREVPLDAPLEVRRRLLSLETVCRMVRGAMVPGPGPVLPWPRPDRLWAALAARRMGFPLLALAIRERIAHDLPGGGPGSLVLRVVLALADLSTIVAATDSLWPRASGQQRLENWALALSHPWLVQVIRGGRDLWEDLEIRAERWFPSEVSSLPEEESQE